MKIAIAAEQEGRQLKEKIKSFLESKNYELMDLSNDDIFDATMEVVKAVDAGQAERGIVIDGYGIAPFMIANKNHEMVCATVYENYTSKMTRQHNNTKIITLGAKITAEDMACQLAQNFAESEYDGGRHQVRIDMLNRMV